MDELIERRKEYAAYRLARAKEEYETAEQVRNAKIFLDAIGVYVTKRLEE